MAATVKIKLGDKEFDVPRFNIGQIEELTEIWATPNTRKHPFAILKLALAPWASPDGEVVPRATPPITAKEIERLDIEVDDLATAVRAILTHSGFAAKGDAGPNVAPPAQLSGAGGSEPTGQG